VKSLPKGPGSIVIAGLQNPKEKYWGMLLELTPAGVWMKGLYLDAFDNWLRQVMEDPDAELELGTSFFPLLRVERLSLDKSMDGIPSYAEIFEQKTGRNLKDLLGEDLDVVASKPLKISLRKSLREVEAQVLLKTLGLLGNDKAAAAKALGTDVETLCNKLKSLGIREEDLVS
jgi:hypothetical protein